jgi:hypothetical protein
MTFQLRSSQIHRHKKGDSRIDLKAAVLVHFSYEKLRLRSLASQIIRVPEDTSDFGIPCKPPSRSDERWGPSDLGHPRYWSVMPLAAVIK